MERYDFIVVGSGFGGSVSALRLAEKGYSVCVIESGKRWKGEDFPRTVFTKIPNGVAFLRTGGTNWHPTMPRPGACWAWSQTS